MRKRTIISLSAAIGALAAAVSVSGCGGSANGSSGGRVSLVADSTPQEAYGQLIPAFQQTSAGKGVSFSQSFGAYGAQIKEGKTPAQADAYLQQLFKNVAVQDKSARDAMQTFTSGKGDVLIAYENEAINAQQKGKAVDYVTPKDTILIQNPIAIT